MSYSFGSGSGNVTFRLTLKEPWEQIGLEQTRTMVKRIASSVNIQAKANAPVLTGALRNSGRISANGDYSYNVKFGGSPTGVYYARRRHYENNLHPGTKYYLSRAAQTVGSKYKQYWPGL